MVQNRFLDMPDFFVYILLCSDGSLYVGHTDDIDKRLSEHEVGKFCGYTSRRRPVTKVYSAPFLSRDDAFNMERKIKAWSRDKKLAFIEENWKLLSELGKKEFE